MNRYFGMSVILVAAIAGVGLGVAVQPAQGQADGKGLVYELRT